MANSFSKFSPLIFITLLCLGGVEGGYLAVERYVLQPPEKTALQKSPADKPAEAIVKVGPAKKDIQIILKRQLFGVPASLETAVEKPPPVPEVDIEASTRDVVLMGTIGGDEAGNKAIILDKTSRKQQLYEVGDAIEGALIDKILRGKVILVADGKSEILDMSKAAEVRSTYKQAKTPRQINPRASVRQRPQRKINVQRRTPVRTRVVARPGRRTSVK